MNSQSIGAQLRTARRKRQWTLANVGRQAEISEARLSQLENDIRYPSEREWNRLRPVLNLGCYRPLDRLEFPAARKLWTAPQPPLRPAAERSLSARLHSARKSFSAVLVDRALAIIKSRPDNRLCEKFLMQAGLESGDECLFWLRMLAGGASTVRTSAARAGFRSLRIVHQTSKETLSDLGHCCLDLEGPGYDCLLFPQVTIDARKAYYRLDALACLHSGRERCWINIEIDGRGHDPRFDQERQALLGLPTVRIAPVDLGAPDLMAVLDRKLLPLLGTPRAV